MKHIKLETRTEQDWSGQFIEESDCKILLNENATVLKPDGDILCVLLKKSVSMESISKAWPALKKANLSTNNRGIASGIMSRQRIKKDGTISKTIVTQSYGQVDSGLIGYFERTSRWPYCRECAFNLNHPEKFQTLLPMVSEVNDLFLKYGGPRAAKQQEIARNSSRSFLIPGSVFTTLTVNRNFRTACHLDAGDLPQGMSCMSLIKEGAYAGGDIVFPDFGVGAKLETGDLIIFDPHEFHGNTPILPMSANYTRCTIVYYYREKIQECGTAAQELERAKRRKTGEKLHGTVSDLHSEQGSSEQLQDG